MEELARAIARPERVPGVRDASALSGLARRTVGFFDVLGQSVAGLAPAAAATTIPVITVAVAAGGSVLSILIAAAVALAVATSVNVFARRVSAAGSLYTFIALGLGRRASVVGGAALLVGYGFVAVFELFAAAHFLVSALPIASDDRVVGVVALVVLGGAFAWILLGGIRLSTRVTLVIEIVTVAAILVLVVFTLARVPVDPAAFVPSTDDLAHLPFGVVIAMTAFVGFESAASLGVEAKRPLATIPRVLVWTVAAAGALFLVVALAEISAFRSLGLPLGESDAPLGDIAHAFGMGWAATALDLLIAVSFFAAAVAATTAIVRVVFSMAHEGVLPAAIGRTSARTGAPRGAIVMVVPLLVAVPIALRAAGADLSLVMHTVLVASGAGFILAYVLVCAGAPAFLLRIGEATFWPIARAAAAAVVLGGALATFLAVAGSSLGYGGVAAFAGALGVVITALAVARRRSTRLVRAVHDVPISSDLLGGAPTDASDARA
ncbi:APC family permease [Microbacterium excoecariae]|uniref:APC family permease n=1 Tax=Microbacterium excoecariae TaxID=2715210 RepID=UPI00140C7C7F|nr:APC family permease [Microbacterium excoecariae]NHI15950.1 APC family permease [Microbacterium excoecariae]